MAGSKPRVACSILVQDGEGRLLVVQEADPRVLGKYNLPGGHLEGGESPLACATRELTEETGLVALPTHLIGVYSQSAGFSFVFGATVGSTATAPGSDILACIWMRPEDILALADQQMLRPKKMRRIIQDSLRGRQYPLELFAQLPLEDWESAQPDR